MGCDIHVIVEVREAEGKPWEVASIEVPDRGGVGYKKVALLDNQYVYQGRHYALFAALAGVRGDGPEPKGLPDDASPIARNWLVDANTHSVSWVDLAGARQALVKLAETMWNGSPCKDEEWEDLIDLCENLVVDEANVRILFGFDN